MVRVAAISQLGPSFSGLVQLLSESVAFVSVFFALSLCVWVVLGPSHQPLWCVIRMMV